MPWNMATWIITVAIIIKLFFIKFCNSEETHNVFWNSTNLRFREDSYTININYLDYLEIYCPNYNRNDATSDYWEYYTIYIVNESQYNYCDLSGVTQNDLRVNCTTPYVKRRFTIHIEKFSVIPNFREYFAGTYYFITTSTGDRHGINNRHGGACVSRTMKVKMIVC